jgi:hypothetical protein
MKQEKMSQNDLVSYYQTIENFIEFFNEKKLEHLWYSGCQFSLQRLKNVDISDLKLKGYYQLSKECLETNYSTFVYETTLSVLGLEQNSFHFNIFYLGYISNLDSVNHSFENKIYQIEDVNDVESWEDFCDWVYDWTTSEYRE